MNSRLGVHTLQTLLIVIGVLSSSVGRGDDARPTVSRPTPRASMAATVARRIQAALHVPVSMGGLYFRLLSASVELHDLRVGAGPAPILAISHLNARPALTSGVARRLLRLDVRGFSLRLSRLASLFRATRRGAGISSVRVDVLRAGGGTLLFGRDLLGGGVTMRGVSLLGRGLRGKLERRRLKIEGSLSFKGKAFRLGSKTLLRHLELKLRGRPGGFTISECTATGFGGKISARGRLRLRGRRSSRLHLVGRFESPSLKGRFSITGPLSQLKVSVSLRSRRGHTFSRVPRLGRLGDVVHLRGLRSRLRRKVWRITGRLGRSKIN